MFIFGCVIFIIIEVVLLNKFGVHKPYSKGIVLAIVLSVAAAISLGQNYTQSLIPEANDGIDISNALAYWIIGEDLWSIEKFKNYFEWSTFITIILVIVSPIVLIIESKFKKAS